MKNSHYIWVTDNQQAEIFQTDEGWFYWFGSENKPASSRWCLPSQIAFRNRADAEQAVRELITAID